MAGRPGGLAVTPSNAALNINPLLVLDLEFESHRTYAVRYGKYLQTYFLKKNQLLRVPI